MAAVRADGLADTYSLKNRVWSAKLAVIYNQGNENGFACVATELTLPFGALTTLGATQLHLE